MTNDNTSGRRPTPVLAGIALVALAFAGGCDADPSTTTASTPVAPSAQPLERQFVQVVKIVGPSVVLVSTDQGLGSGIVFDTNGNIVTTDLARHRR